MAGSMNKVILVGNTGRDPEVRYSQDGAKIVNLSIATSESWKDKTTGERRDKTEWHRVVIFNERLADVAEQYVRKGAKLAVEGQLQTRKWTDQSGQDRYTTEIVISRFRGELTLLDSRASNSNENNDVQSTFNATTNTAPLGSTATNNVSGNMPAMEMPDDEIPF